MVVEDQVRRKAQFEVGRFGFRVGAKFFLKRRRFTFGNERFHQKTLEQPNGSTPLLSDFVQVSLTPVAIDRSLEGFSKSYPSRSSRGIYRSFAESERR